jgi:hypothetical protein
VQSQQSIKVQRKKEEEKKEHRTFFVQEKGTDGVSNYADFFPEMLGRLNTKLRP